MDKRWRDQLNEAFGEAPEAPRDEYQRIMRRVQDEGSLWPTFLAAASLALGILVSLFVQPQSTSTTETATLTVEVSTGYDESLEGLESLAEQVE